MPQVLLSPAARRDLRKIWTYSRENWGTSTAEDYVQGLDDLIAQMPDGQLKGMLCSYIRPGYYRIFFQIARPVL